jgi:hypothetical protein
MRNSDFQVEQQRTILFVAGIFVVAVIGIAMIWMGFAVDSGKQTEEERTTPTATSLAPVVQPSSVAIVPTYTPLPTDTLLPPTATTEPTPQPEPMVVAQTGGVNLRSGPGSNFGVVGRLDGGLSAKVIGRYADWWQVEYSGSQVWVANWVVTATDVENVPEVAPPASPIPPTAPPPTQVPPTATSVPPTQAPDTRGIVADAFVVGNKKGDSVKPNTTFGNSNDVWFLMRVTNSGDTVQIPQWGVYVQETGDFQKSWGGPGGGQPLTLNGGATKEWMDHINQFTLPQGKFHLWMRMCFQDGYCVNIAGPVVVDIG